MIRQLLPVLLLLLVAAAAPAQTEIRWKFAPGDKLYAEEVLVSDQSMTVSGNTTKHKAEQTTVSSYYVHAVKEDGSLDLTMKIESVKSDDPLSARLAGASFRVLLNSKLEAVKVEGYEAFIEKMSAADPQTAAMVRNIVTEEALLSSFGRMLRIAPGKPVSPGEVWSYRHELPAGAFGGMVVAQSNTYQGEELVEGRKLQKLTIAGNAAWSPPKPKGNAVPFSIVKGNLKIKGLSATAWFDSSAGRLVKFEMPALETSGKLTLRIREEEQEVEIVQTQSMQVRFYTDAATK